jgi:hypothetical protein
MNTNPRYDSDARMFEGAVDDLAALEIAGWDEDEAARLIRLQGTPNEIRAGVVADDEWFAEHLWLPYSPTDVLALAAKLAGTDARYWIRVIPLGEERVGRTAVVSQPQEDDDARAFSSFPASLDPLLAALDVLGQVAETP